MNIWATIALYGDGTSEGATKGWDARGRGTRAETESLLRSYGYGRVVSPNRTFQTFETGGHNWQRPGHPEEKVYVGNEHWEYKTSGSTERGGHEEKEELENLLKDSLLVRGVPIQERTGKFAPRSSLVNVMDLNLNPRRYSQTVNVIPVMGD